MQRHTETLPLLYVICFLRTASGSSEGDISPSAGRGRTTSHRRGYGPSCRGTSLDPEDHVLPMP